MCGGVRGVGAGGIVSTAYCLLYKLFTLKLTRKQLNGLVTHCDSPFIRALGFMYIRYTQPPQNLLDWFEHYLDDEEELDVKAGGGQVMKIGAMLRQWLVKLEWFSTLFPRIPVPIQQRINAQLNERFPPMPVTHAPVVVQEPPEPRRREWADRERNREPKGDKDWGRERERERDWDRERDRMKERERDRIRDRSPYNERHRRISRERDHHYTSKDRENRSSSKYKQERDKYRK